MNQANFNLLYTSSDLDELIRPPISTIDFTDLTEQEKHTLLNCEHSKDRTKLNDLIPPYKYVDEKEYTIRLSYSFYKEGKIFHSYLTRDKFKFLISLIEGEKFIAYLDFMLPMYIEDYYNNGELGILEIFIQTAYDCFLKTLDERGYMLIENIDHYYFANDVI